MKSGQMIRTDPMSRFLKRSGNLLTREGEVYLARKVQQGGEAGEVAKKELAEANLRFVIYIAQKHRNANVSLDDLIQEGMFGLFRAIELFDPSKGYRFASYAVWWIRQSVRRARGEQMRQVRMPVYVLETIRQLNQVRAILKDGGNSVHDIVTLLELPRGKTRRLLKIAQSAMSLQATVGVSQNNDGTDLGSLLEDMTIDAPDVVSEDSEKADLMRAILKSLSPKEDAVLRLRYGFSPPRVRRG